MLPRDGSARKGVTLAARFIAPLFCPALFSRRASLCRRRLSRTLPLRRIAACFAEKARGVMLDQTQIDALLSTYGYAAVFGALALECAGLPLPGETLLVGASAYVAARGGMSLPLVIVSGASGAAIGDLCGYALGRRFGVALFERYGGKIGLGRKRLTLARYLFARFGGWLVFFARFVTLLRILGGPLAGAHRYDLRKFLIFNISGALVWTTLICGLGYFLPALLHRLQGPFGVGAFAALIVALLWLRRYCRQHEARLTAEAEAAFSDAPQTAAHP
jgi:membrane protein DedA with SNARE-associated domain